MRLLLGLSVLFSATAIFVSPARATLTYDFTGSGTSVGQPVAATASFAITSGKIVLTLANTTPYTASAAQLLTGISFDLSNGTTAILGANLTSAVGTSRVVATNGTFTDGASTNIADSWAEYRSGGSYLLADWNGLDEAIIGPANSTGRYTANSSINGSSSHNPFTGKTGYFTMTSSAFGANTRISNVTFFYNTDLSSCIAAIPATPIIPTTPVPEPATLAFGFALLGICSVKRFRSTQDAVLARDR